MTVHVVPVECVNKAAGCFKLWPATVLAWQEHCGRFCVLLNTQWLFLCVHGWVNPEVNLPSACPPTPYTIIIIIINGFSVQQIVDVLRLENVTIV